MAAAENSALTPHHSAAAHHGTTTNSSKRRIHTATTSQVECTRQAVQHTTAAHSPGIPDATPQCNHLSTTPSPFTSIESNSFEAATGLIVAQTGCVRDTGDGATRKPESSSCSQSPSNTVSSFNVITPCPCRLPFR